MAKHGAALIHDGDSVLHHCNTGALAVVDYGTALGVIRMAHEQGKRFTSSWMRLAHDFRGRG